MPADEIELMKLRLQSELQQQQARERSEQRWSDLFKWFVALIWPLLVNGGAGYIQHRQIATSAAVVEEKTDAIAKDTAITAAINTEWKAGRTGDPVDMAKAERAAAKVEAMP